VGWLKICSFLGNILAEYEIIKIVLTHLKIDGSFFIVENIPSAVTGCVLVEIITYIIRQIIQFYDGKTM